MPVIYICKCQRGLAADYGKAVEETVAHVTGDEYILIDVSRNKNNTGGRDSKTLVTKLLRQRSLQAKNSFINQCGYIISHEAMLADIPCITPNPPFTTPIALPRKITNPIPADLGSSLPGRVREDRPTEPSDDSKDDIRPPGRRGRRGPGGSINKKVEVGGAGPAPRDPSPTTPKVPPRRKSPSRSPTLPPREADDPPPPLIAERTLPDVEEDGDIADTNDKEGDIEAQLLEYTTRLLNDSNAGLAAALVNEKYWQAAADTFNVPLKRLLQQSTNPQRYISLPDDFSFNLEFGLMAY
ncbi:hypothetical protein NX059_003725 [Plenodomus lindquistii]|nr:hypothetical protein NX059_003725 [Plenodomus lindquistii]